MLVTAVNAAATAFGTETVTNIEMINFFIPGQANGGFISITTRSWPDLTLLGTSENDVLVGGLGNDTIDPGTNIGGFAGFDQIKPGFGMMPSTSATRVWVHSSCNMPTR